MRWFCGMTLLLAVVLEVGSDVWAPRRASAQDRWNVPESAKKMKNPIRATATSIQKGKRLFAEHCAMCHGDAGKGDGPMAEALETKPADLTDRARMTLQSDGELFWKISKGNPPMPDFEGTLSTEEIWHLVNYLRALAR
ncbi:Cbb3-type cytochrome c oxidase subunit FixP [bacterium HR10]|nr:Cbb3-type cytochrome c oxidase subunit FixP [bacterium HR10]